MPASGNWRIRSLIQSGMLRAIAVLGNKRMAVLAPKKTPKAIVDKLSIAIRQAVEQRPVVEQFAAIGTEARGSTPEEFTRFLQAETARWTEVVAKANIRVSN